MMGIFALAAYAATIPAANWMIENIGACIPHGPCVIPVGFGLSAPSGVLMIGAALFLRDIVQDRLGLKWAVAAIIAGAAISSAFVPPALVAASVAAFILSEIADLAVYTPLRRRGMAMAILASGAVGSVIDSAVFLTIAFGSLDFIAGQIVGKLWFSVAAAIIIAQWGARRET